MKTKIGAGVLLLVVGVVGHVAFGAERTDARASKQDRGSPKSESNHDLLEQELATLPDGVAMQLTEEIYPGIYEFFRGRIAAKEQARVSPSGAAGCFGARSSIRAVDTTGGVLGILDRGDGVVHVLAVVIDDENPDLGNTDGLALSAIITDDGVEVLSMDMDRLARFVGGDTDAVTGDGRVTSVDKGHGDLAKAAGGVAIDCNWTGSGVCCAVVTENRFCVCCATIDPLNVGCSCTPLP